MYLILTFVCSEVLGYFCCCCFSVFAAVGLDVKAAIGGLIGGDVTSVISRLHLNILNIALGLNLNLGLGISL